MDNLLVMLNALDNVKTNTLGEKIVKQKSMQVIIDFMKNNNYSYEYKVGKGFVKS